jgi:hypothetical protein
LTHIAQIHVNAADDIQFEAKDWPEAPNEVRRTDRSVIFDPSVRNGDVLKQSGRRHAL